MNTSDKNEYKAPSYPTLAQVRAYGKRSRLPKIVAATAIVATMGLSAGCGESAKNFSAKRLFKKELKKLTHSSETEEYALSGDVAVPDPTDETEYTLSGSVVVVDPTETTDWELSGEESVMDPTSDSDWELAGEEVAPDPTEETDDLAQVTDATDMTTEYRIEGGVACEIPDDSEET